MVSKPSEPQRKDRARSDQDKELRRAAILETALELWREARYEAITMNLVAERANLAKGTLYLYFPTKQELFLALLDALMAPWFGQVQAALTAVAPAQGAALLVRSLEGHHDMVRLLCILSTILEAGSSPEAVARFKRSLMQRTATLSAALERSLGLEPGQGTRLLLHFNALIVGLHQMALPLPGVSDQPEFAPIAVDFAQELEYALHALIAGT